MAMVSIELSDGNVHEYAEGISAGLWLHSSMENKEISRIS